MEKGTKEAVMNYEEILRIGREVWSDDRPWDNAPEVIELRDSEENGAKLKGQRMLEDYSIYEKGIERNKEWLKDDFGRAITEQWQKIIEEEGFEKVVEMHLNPRTHQQLLSSSPFHIHG